LDVALLKFRSDGVKIKPLRAVRTEPTPGEGVVAIGFIDDVLLPAKGEITSTTGRGGNWVTTASFNPGFSGGPVIRRDGKVVGIARAGRAGAEQHRYVIPVSHADALFRMAAVSIDEDAVPVAPPSIPPRSDYGDLLTECSCEDRHAL
jgi:S1-C subfamily serine protease